MIELEEPDKGRAWVVAIAACIINMILSGLSRMVGILYVSLIDTYGVTRGEATLPFTVRNSVRCISGPVVGIVGVRYGIRTVTFFGGVLAFIGASLCSIAPDVVWITVFWGVIHGLGFSLANTLFQVVVNQYFQKYRATASGIALSGACLGSLGFPILVEWILDTYGLSGGFLILGGIVMHVLPPSLLLSSPQWVEHPEGYARLWALKTSSKSPAETEDNSVIATDTEDRHFPKRVSRSISMSNNPIESAGVSKASKDLNRNMERGIIFDHSEDFQKRKDSVICTGYEPRGFSLSDSTVELNNRPKSSPNDDFGIFTISGQLQGGSTTREPEPCPVPPASSQKKDPPTVMETIRSMVHLYANPVYILISLCMCTYVIIFIPTLTVVIDYSKDKGFQETYGKFILNAMAIGDMIGRLGFGWVTDKKYMTLPVFMFSVLALQGVFVAVLPLADSIPAFFAVLVLYSTAAGCLVVIFPVLVFHYIDMNVQSVAISNMGLLSGITSFGIPSMINKFRDNLGSYDGMFYLTGAISLLSGLMWLLVPLAGKLGWVKSNNEIIRVENNGQNSTSEQNP
ncbi:hypothetical protein JTE90_022263 [Oedothorax gibbosus]|uniref:Monocarboxylate transporter n=1 Tax=Oedothorax gibbosus TaxID=931172 RepID=A0AAV6VY43_9ARAC|nr:hypothetical protein JTE90_022263 [Oedothorax gibbosus]